jgi:transcription termination/antitermination protein NusA
MASGISANKLELLQIADAVAREKGIEMDIVLSAMADAIQKAAKARYGQENDIRVDIDPKTGETKLLRVVTVVELVENDDTEISLAIAQRDNADAALGDEVIDELPPVEFGRIATQAAKQVIVQRVREAERERQYEEFKDRVGEIINGVVKRVEYGNAVLDLGRSEAVVRRDNLIPREVFRPGDRIRAYIQNVRREQRGPQVILSRTDPAFMSKLFMQEVPEIYDGVIEVRAVARDPGSRAKIGVISNDPGIDPVGACVGMRGSRVQAVVNELQGEKVDIIPWSPDPAAFIVNALAPAEVTKVVLDEDVQRIEVVVPDEQLSLAIGRRGQNVRLASQLTGWDIDIMTEAQESERRQTEFAERTALFMEALDVDEMIAQLLASEGFATVEEVAYVPVEEITHIEGFDEETAQEIQNRARDYLDRENEKLDAQRKEMGVADALAAMEGLTPAMLVRLGENDIKSLEDFAGCVTDDLTGWFETAERRRVRQEGILDGFDINAEEAENMIMAARVEAGWITQEELDQQRADEAARAAEEAAAAAEEANEADGEPSVEGVFRSAPKAAPETAAPDEAKSDEVKSDEAPTDEGKADEVKAGPSAE